KALTARQARLSEVRATLRHLAGARPRTDARAVLPALREQLTDWQGLLAGEPAGARQVLRMVLEGRLVLTPKITKQGRFYEWSGPATYGRLLAGVIGVRGSVARSCYNRASTTTVRSCCTASSFTSWTGEPPRRPPWCCSTGSPVTPGPGTTRRARSPPATGFWSSTSAATATRTRLPTATTR